MSDTPAAAGGKPPLAPLPLDISAHARFALFIALVLSVAGMLLMGPSMGKAMWMGGFIAGVVLEAIAFSIFIVGGSFWLMARGWRRLLERYRAGGYVVEWTYAEPQWSDYLARRGKRTRNLTLTFIGAFALSGLVVAWQMQQDDDMIFANPAVNYLALTVSGAIVGLLVGLGLKAGRRYARRRLGPQVPRCVAGRDGFYLGGEFLPIRSVWQRALAMSLHTDGWPRIEVLMRVVTGQAVIRRTDIIPVPPGREAEARAVIAQLGF